MKKSFKKYVAAFVAASALFSFQASEAAFKLSSDVKDATPALLQAAQIGVLEYENPELQKLENKDAIVVVAFGTTFKGTREKTIDATVNEIQAAHPDTKVVVAFTSHIIIKRIEAKEGIKYPTPEEALEKLKAEGYSRVALTSFHIFPGMEYDYQKAVFNLHKNDFKKLVTGVPIMYWMGQEEQRDDIAEFVQALKTQFPKQGKKDAVLLMAHGTAHPSNAFYSVIQDRIEAAGLKNVYLYTVEGWPSLEDVIPKLKANKIENVTLMPMMMVAGDHAMNDMASDEPDSHKTILEAQGFKVETYLHGLGENEAVRNMFVERANESWDYLQGTVEAE